ncbi:hypothetical protein GSI_13635 [Ganoderma sinense ZZ0214-1]|uniref:Uncharacterized protein n=1 Tax=Ganoderma sinense ZZ0214-1 TaxID=1077348 RepID=A0A2G8RQU7_9APHY|nr:hypothetical protein GSI_13635 [Ganoderma sinense ZZ0214-1]
MSRVTYQAVTPQQPAVKASCHRPSHPGQNNFFRTWTPSLGLWGAGTGVAALFLLSVTPLVKRGFLSKVPMIGGYWEDKTPASDKPF